MKQLLVIRHAKSSWGDPSLADFDRPLNKRGKRNAPQMGRILRDDGFIPDTLLSSPALRAASTARAIAGELNFPRKDIHYDDRIYEAWASGLVRILQELAGSVETVFLVGHNPGLLDLVNHLVLEGLDSLVTCGIAEVHLDLKQWSDVGEGQGRLFRYRYPKMFR